MSGDRISGLRRPPRRSERFAAWSERLWRRPVAYGALALAVLITLSIPITQLKIAMPSIKVIPTSDSSRVGYRQLQEAMGQRFLVDDAPLYRFKLRYFGDDGTPSKVVDAQPNNAALAFRGRALAAMALQRRLASEDVLDPLTAATE